MGGQKVFRPEPGFWYVTVSNCGDTDAPKGAKFSSGEIVLSNRYGYLPGEEVPKLSFYLYLFLGYVTIFGLWIVLCSARSPYLLKIHHYITIACLVGALEAACWYASLYHWNFLGHRWWSMISLASFGTVTKQGVSYGLLLLASLGLGVTKPRMGSKQMVHCVILVCAFVVFDGMRQVALVVQDRIYGINSNVKILFLVLPGSVFVSILYTWIFSALQETIKELSEKKQAVKLEVYVKLRNAIAICTGLVMIAVSYETFYVRRTDLSDNWSTRWIYTDAVSHIVFFFLLVTMMVLWRPNERSAQLAYSEQIVFEMENQKEGIEITGGGVGETGVPKDFESVDVELGEEQEDDFSFNKSMQEAKTTGKKPVLE